MASILLPCKEIRISELFEFEIITAQQSNGVVVVSRFQNFADNLTADPGLFMDDSLVALFLIFVDEIAVFI